jgi:hypothetical protein
MSRRQTAIDPFRRFVAVLGVALVLALTVLAVCPPLHAWLHGEKQLDADDCCAVVLFAQGVTPTAAALIGIVVALRLLAEELPASPRPFLEAIRFQFPPCCGPPSN